MLRNSFSSSTLIIKEIQKFEAWGILNTIDAVLLIGEHQEGKEFLLQGCAVSSSKGWLHSEEFSSRRAPRKHRPNTHNNKRNEKINSRSLLRNGVKDIRLVFSS